MISAIYDRALPTCWTGGKLNLRFLTVYVPTVDVAKLLPDLAVAISGGDDRDARNAARERIATAIKEGFADQIASLHLSPLVSTCLHLSPLVSTCLHKGDTGNPHSDARAVGVFQLNVLPTEATKQ
jgi:hypothetical protein